MLDELFLFLAHPERYRCAWCHGELLIEAPSAEASPCLAATTTAEFTSRNRLPATDPLHRLGLVRGTAVAWSPAASGLGCRMFRPYGAIFCG